MAAKRKKIQVAIAPSRANVSASIDEARKHINAKQHAEAVVVLRQSEPEGIESCEFLTLYARAIAIAGDNEERTRIAQLIVEKFPTDVRALLAAAGAFSKANKAYEASAVLRSAIWPAAGFVDTEKRCFMKPEVCDAEA